MACSAARGYSARISHRCKDLAVQRLKGAGRNRRLWVRRLT